MESPPPLHPHPLLPSNTLRRRSSSSSSSNITDGATASSSPEFEFWMVGRNNSSNTPDSTHLPSADELFSDGVIRPLHLLSTSTTHHHHLLSDANLDPILDPGSTAREKENPLSFDSNKTQSSFTSPPQINHEPETVPDLDPESSLSASILSSSSACLTSSKRWKDIFKKIDKRLPPRTDGAGTVTSNRNTSSEKKEKIEVIKKKSEKKRSEKGGSSVAELNINLWPFSRSRSTGNNSTGGKPRYSISSGRKASSAPCSRSNSSKSSRKSLPNSSPGQAMTSSGVRLGRSSPVWQLRRNGSGKAEKGGVFIKKDVSESSGSRDRPIGKGRGRGKNIGVLNLNVPMWIGNRQNMMSCRNYEMFGARGRAEDSGAGGGGGVTRGSRSGGRLFMNLRGQLTKKVY